MSNLESSPQSSSPSRLSIWSAGALAISGFFATSNAALASATLPAANLNNTVASQPIDGEKEAEKKLDEKTIELCKTLILDSLNPNLTRGQREGAETRLASIDPGAKELLQIAWHMINEDPTVTDKARFEALRLFVLTRQLNIEFPNRVGLERIDEICHNRLNQRSDGRPLAISVCCKGDYNGAFYIGDNMYDEMIEAGYRVLYFEANSDMEIIEALMTGTLLGTRAAQQAKLIIIGGHGNRTSLHLEGASSQLPDGRGYIDPNDEELFNQVNLARTLAPGGQIVLDSCSNGAGRAELENMANFMRRVFKHAKKQGIWSATQSYGPISLSFDKKGELTQVNYPVPSYPAFQEDQPVITSNAFTPVDIRR